MGLTVKQSMKNQNRRTKLPESRASSAAVNSRISTVTGEQFVYSQHIILDNWPCMALFLCGGFRRFSPWRDILASTDDVRLKAWAHSPVDGVHNFAGLTDIFFYLPAALYQQ